MAITIKEEVETCEKCELRDCSKSLSWMPKPFGWKRGNSTQLSSA